MGLGVNHMSLERHEVRALNIGDRGRGINGMCIPMIGRSVRDVKRNRVIRPACRRSTRSHDPVPQRVKRGRPAERGKTPGSHDPDVLRVDLEPSVTDAVSNPPRRSRCGVDDHPSTPERAIRVVLYTRVPTVCDNPWTPTTVDEFIASERVHTPRTPLGADGDREQSHYGY